MLDYIAHCSRKVEIKNKENKVERQLKQGVEDKLLMYYLSVKDDVPILQNQMGHPSIASFTKNRPLMVKDY